MKRVWENYGNLVHLLSSSKPMSFEEILDEIRKDTTNYPYKPNDICIWSDSVGTLPTFENVALSLIRCIEAKFIEVVPD